METERLRLRAFRGSDSADYAAMYSDRDVVRHLGGGPEPWDRGRACRHLAFMMGHWQLHGVGTWAVEEKETGTFLGVTGFAAPEGWPGFELAWALARRFWGFGYATESARAALSHAFEVWRQDRVISLIHPENHASIRIAERLGERLEGRVQHFGREMLCLLAAVRKGVIPAIRRAGFRACKAMVQGTWLTDARLRRADDVEEITSPFLIAEIPPFQTAVDTLLWHRPGKRRPAAPTGSATRRDSSGQLRSPAPRHCLAGPP